MIKNTLKKIETKVSEKMRFDAKYTFRGGFWLMLGHVFTVLAILATSYFFANYLDPTTYGIYKYLTTAGIILTAFSLTGMNIAVTQAAAKSVVGFFLYAQRLSLQYGLFITTLALIGAIYYGFNDNWQLAIGLIIIAILQPILNASGLIFPYLIGKQKFRVSTTAHIGKTIVTSALIVVAIVLSQNVWVILSTFLLSNILANYLTQKFSHAKEALVDKSDVKVIEIKNYAKHVSLQNIISTITNNLDKILIFQNLGSRELAIYAFATALPDQYKGLTKTIEMMLLPRFSQQTQKSVRSKMIHKSIIYFIFMLILYAIYVFIAPYIFSILYPAYTQSVYLSQIYALGILFAIGSIPVAGLRSSLDKKRLYIYNISTSVFQIIALLILLPWLGLLGVVISKVIYRLFSAIMGFVLYFNLTREST